MRILFVCTGNTCRSAMAEGIMKHELEKQGVDAYVFSRGIYASKDNPASGLAISVLKSNYKIDISKHRSARLTFDDIENCDIIFVMTENHKSIIHTTLDDDSIAQKIRIFSERDIMDPYMGNKKDYEGCSREIYKGVKKIIKEYLKT